MGTRLRQQACCSTNIGPSVETEPNRHHVHAQQKKSLRLKFELRPRVRLRDGMSNFCIRCTPLSFIALLLERRWCVFPAFLIFHKRKKMRVCLGLDDVKESCSPRCLWTTMVLCCFVGHRSISECAENICEMRERKKMKYQSSELKLCL